MFCPLLASLATPELRSSVTREASPDGRSPSVAQSFPHPLRGFGHSFAPSVLWGAPPPDPRQGVITPYNPPLSGTGTRGEFHSPRPPRPGGLCPPGPPSPAPEDRTNPSRPSRPSGVWGASPPTPTGGCAPRPPPSAFASGSPYRPNFGFASVGRGGVGLRPMSLDSLRPSGPPFARSACGATECDLRSHSLRPFRSSERSMLDSGASFLSSLTRISLRRSWHAISVLSRSLKSPRSSATSCLVPRPFECPRSNSDCMPALRFCFAKVVCWRDFGEQFEGRFYGHFQGE